MYLFSFLEGYTDFAFAKIHEKFPLKLNERKT